MIALAVLALHIGHPGNLSHGKVNAIATDVTPTISKDSIMEKNHKKGVFGDLGRKRNSEST